MIRQNCSSFLIAYPFNSNHAGLLDADDSSDFYAKLESLKEVWDNRGRPFATSQIKSSFFDYIEQKVSLIGRSGIEQGTGASFKF